MFLRCRDADQPSSRAGSEGLAEAGEPLRWRRNRVIMKLAACIMRWPVLCSTTSLWLRPSAEREHHGQGFHALFSSSMEGPVGPANFSGAERAMRD